MLSLWKKLISMGHKLGCLQNLCEKDKRNKENHSPFLKNLSKKDTVFGKRNHVLQASLLYKIAILSVTF